MSAIQFVQIVALYFLIGIVVGLFYWLVMTHYLKEKFWSGVKLNKGTAMLRMAAFWPIMFIATILIVLMGHEKLIQIKKEETKCL
jgi:hypothetical protein